MRLKDAIRPPVTQKHPAGCAVACVAYTLNRSYDASLRLFDRSNQAIDRGFLCSEIVLALERGGRTFSFCKKTKCDASYKQPGVIVFIARSQKYPIGHFLVRTEDGSWMNSWINFPCIVPAASGFQSKLPGTAQWIIYPICTHSHS